MSSLKCSCAWQSCVSNTFSTYAGRGGCALGARGPRYRELSRYKSTENCPIDTEVFQPTGACRSQISLDSCEEKPIVECAVNSNTSRCCQSSRLSSGLEN